VSSNVKPTSYRADIDDTNGAVPPTTATIRLKPDQLDYGKRETTVDTNTAEGTVTLQGLTIYPPSEVQNAMGELGIDAPYTIGQIPVWLREKLGYVDSDQTVNPSQQWDIAVTLTYDDGTVATATAGQLVAEKLDDATRVVPTTTLKLEGLAIESSPNNVGLGDLSTKAPPRVEITDSIFSHEQITDTAAVPSNEWLLWTPTFDSLSEAFAVLMSGYLQLFQIQLQLSSSVVDWYNGQIESLNDALSVVTSWGLWARTDPPNSDNDSDIDLYSPSNTLGSDHGHHGEVNNHDNYLRAQRDSVTWVLNQFNIDLNAYLTGYDDDRYRWGTMNSGSQTFDNFNTEVKSEFSNLQNAAQQKTTVFSDLTSSYSNGVSTLTQMLSKLTSAKQTILQKG
jgi:hypothetical protein